MEIQVGSKQQPIIIIPRINGIAETVARIKGVFSNFFVNDATTPISWTLEFKTRTGAIQTVVFDAANSTDTQIFFFPPDSMFAAVEEFTIAVFWTIGVEKVYTEQQIVFEVKDLHNEP